MVITRTPLRISLFGGGSDYPQWYKEHGGIVVSGTIDKYSYVTARVLPPFFDYNYVVMYSVLERTKHVDQIRHPMVRNVLQQFAAIKEIGLEIHYDADLPARSGMGTSSAFTVGLLNNMHTLLDHPDTTSYDLALEAILVERTLIQEVVGDQDQIACALGGLNLISFNTDGSHGIERLLLTHDQLMDLSTHLLLVYTGTQRISSTVSKTYEFNEKQIEGIVNLADSGIIAVKAADYELLGKLLNEGWKLKRSYSKVVTNGVIDELHARAMSLGALGGKLLGAGGGGFMLFVVPDLYTRELLTNDFAADGLVVVPFTFEEKGTQVIFNNGM